MSVYIFDEQQADQELVRLKLIEAAFDFDSIQFLKQVQIKKNGCCLEIGPGAGSIFSWLGEQVGPEGRVLGIDKSTKYLHHFTEAPYEVIQGNFAEMTFENPFDFIHCRYVLIHNPKEAELIPKIKTILKPGGCVVLEEPDFTSALFFNDPADLPQRHVNTAISGMFVDLGLNPAYGLSLPQNLVQNGFEIVDVQSKLHLAPGGSPVAKVMRKSAEALAEKYIATGKANAFDIKQYIANTEDEQYWSVYYSTISAIAKRPE